MKQRKKKINLYYNISILSHGNIVINVGYSGIYKINFNDIINYKKI